MARDKKTMQELNNVASLCAANMDFMNSEAGKNWQRTVDLQARKIFDLRKAEETLLWEKYGNSPANCLAIYSGNVVSQSNFMSDRTLDEFYPYLQIGKKNPGTLTEFRLSDGPRKYVFPGTLIDLRGQRVHGFVFNASKTLLRYLGEDESYKENMGPCPGQKIHYARRTPVIYLPSEEVFTGEVNILTVSQGDTYFASPFKKGIDLSDRKNYVTSELVLGDSSESLYRECFDEAKKDVPKKEYGYVVPKLS